MEKIIYQICCRNMWGMATITFIFIAVFQTANAQNQSVYFNTDVYSVSKAERKKIEKLADDFLIAGNNIIRITGFADSVGSVAYNLKLSEKRALVIKNILVERGIEPTSIFLAYEGEKKHQTDLKENRRVDMVGMKGIIPAKTVLMQMEPSLQQFSCNANEDVIITGEKGTELEVQKDIFVDQAGNPVKGEVQIELKEYYTVSDFILGGLTTTSGQHIIESGGTIYVRALHNGKDVQLAPGKQIKIGFTSEYDNDMRAFYGNKLPDGFLNWMVDSRSTNRKVGNNFKAVKQDTSILSSLDENDIHNIHYFDNIHDELRGLNKEEASTFKMMKPVSNTLYISKLGWINCDKFMKDPNAVSTDVIVNIKCDGATKWSNVYLVLEDYFSVIDLKPHTINGSIVNSVYAITEMKLPKGVKATVIAVNSNEKGIFFAQKTLNLLPSTNLDIELKSMCPEQVKEELMCMNKKE